MADRVIRVEASGSGGGTQPPQPPQPPTPTPGGGGGSPTPGGNNPPPQPPTPPQPPVPTPPTPTPPRPGSGGLPTIPTYERLAQDIRREIAARGVIMVPGTANFSQLMNNISNQQRQQAYDAIEQRRNFRQTQLSDETDRRLADADSEVERLKQEQIARGVDPSRADRWAESEYKKRQRQIWDDADKKFEDINSEADQERVNVDKDLERAIRALTEELKSGNQDSYVNRLKGDYQEAIWRRDNADSKEEAEEAAREARKIQHELATTLGGGNRPNSLMELLNKGGWYGAITQGIGLVNQGVGLYRSNTLSEIDTLRMAANGDMFGAYGADLARRKQNIIGGATVVGSGVLGAVGGVLAGTGTLGIGTGAGLAGGLALGGSLGASLGSLWWNTFYADKEAQNRLGMLWSDQEKRISQYTGLANMLRGLDRNGNSLGTIRDFLIGGVENSTDGNKEGLRGIYGQGGLSIYDLGYTGPQAAAMISSRIQARGFMDRNFTGTTSRAITEDALEKALNMSNGSMGQLDAYDRYGNNAVQAMTDLVASLDKRNVKGMNSTQHLRANEYMGYMTSLMEMQKGWRMAPNADYATRQLLTAQDIYGDNLDARGIQRVAQMDNALINPQEGMAKVFTYDMIQNMFPETRGSLLEIRKKQYSTNAADRSKMQKSMIDKLISVYGGVDTTSGYLALSQYTGIENPYELEKFIKGMKGGLRTVEKGDTAELVRPMKEYTPEMSKEMMRMTDDQTQSINENLSELKGVSTQMLNTFREQLKDIIDELKK